MNNVGLGEQPMDALFEFAKFSRCHMGYHRLLEPPSVGGIMEVVYDQQDLMSLTHKFSAKVCNVGCLAVLVEAGCKDHSQGGPSSLGLS